MMEKSAASYQAFVKETVDDLKKKLSSGKISMEKYAAAVSSVSEDYTNKEDKNTNKIPI